MIHSRPGFAPRSNDAETVKLNEDMVPAINRTARPQTTNLKQALEARSHEINVAHAKKIAEAQLAAAKQGELLVNPAPSATPHVNEPGK